MESADSCPVPKFSFIHTKNRRCTSRRALQEKPVGMEMYLNQVRTVLVLFVFRRVETLGVVEGFLRLSELLTKNYNFECILHTTHMAQTKCLYWHGSKLQGLYQIQNIETDPNTLEVPSKERLQDLLRSFSAIR